MRTERIPLHSPDSHVYLQAYWLNNSLEFQTDQPRPVVIVCPGGGYGVHSEMFTTGLMRLHQAGKVANQKGLYDGVSVATFAAGSRELYDWLHENHEVAFLPVDLVNSPEHLDRQADVVRTAVVISVENLDPPVCRRV